MNWFSGTDSRGLRRISILVTALALLLAAGALFLLRPQATVQSPEPKRSEYARMEPELKADKQAARPERDPEVDPLEKVRKAAPVQKSALKSDPLASVANPIFASTGQGDGRLMLRDQNVNAWFTDRGVTLAAVFPKIENGPNTLALKWGLVGADAVEPRPEGELVTRINQFIGDRSQWKTNLSSYSRVNYDEVMPGVDLTIDSRPHALKYTVRLAAGVDPSVLQFRYEGADGVEVAEDGKSLKVVSRVGTMSEGELEVWQENGGARIPVAARYEKTGSNEYAIRLDGVNPDLPITVDPTYSWGSFIGGSQTLTGGDETGRCIVTDASNNPWVGGSTQSADFPTTFGVMQRKHLGGGSDGYVAKFTLTCTMVWCTYIGGSGSDSVLGIKLDSSNNPVVVGSTTSYNFPTTAGSFQPTYPISPPNGTTMGFIAKLDGTTAQLLWGSYLGGNAYTLPQGLAIDSNNELYVTGYTGATNLPGLAGSYDPTFNGGSYDAFVTKVKASGNGVAWSTYLGGTGADYGTCIAVDTSFNSYVGGYTSGAATFPSSGVFLGTTGSYDGFVTKLNPTGTGIVWSRLVGGSSSDYIQGIAVDNASPPYVYITGYTFYTGVSGNWPINLGPAHGPSYDAFITRIKPAGDFLDWSRYLGGNNADYGRGVFYDVPNTMVFVTGTTYSTDFPCTVTAAGPPATIAAYRNTLSGSTDIFCSRLTATGSLIWSTYFGGSGNEDGNAVATTAGWFWITGYTNSTNFPTGNFPIASGVWSTSLIGSSDAYITRLNPFNAGASGLSSSTFLGGSHGVASTSIGYYRSMGVDSAGNVAIGGYTSAIDYPDTAGTIITPLNNAAGNTKAVITKLPADGSASSPPMWSTYLGGSSSDVLYSLAVNAAGDVFVTGYTYSLDFPTTGSYRTTLSGTEDAFVTRIRSDGALLQYSTFFGGSDSDEYGEFIAVDNSNNAYIVGEAYSTTLPWTGNAVKTILGGGQDMFVTRFNSAGNLTYCSYLGGDLDAEYPGGLAVDNSGFAYITGNTYCSDYPIVGGLGTGFDGNALFVTKLNTNAPVYGYSTFLGGSSSEYSTCIAVDSLGSAIVGGYTTSTDFPTSPGAFQTIFRGLYDSFVTKISVAGNSIDWSTLLGGSNYDLLYSLGLDNAGNVYVTGATQSADFPMTPPLLNPSYSGDYDVFVTRINSGGLVVPWSTFLGGGGSDIGYSLSVGPGGNVYVGGTTTSPEFPATPGSFSATKSGNQDLFVVRINNDPPAAPGSLAQYRSNGTTVIATGGSTNEPSVIMKGISGDPEGDSYKLQVEVRAVGIAFTSPTTIPSFGVDYFDGVFVPAGTTATVTVTGRTNPTQYHWQARSVDASGGASAWVLYGGNSEFILPSTPAATDFRVDTVTPILNISQSNPTYTQGSNIGLSGNVSDDVAIFQVQWVNSTTSTSGFATVTAPTWTSGSISLQNGVVNVITVTVTDTAGNTNAAVQQISVVQDSTAPTIATSSPTSGTTFITKNTTVNLVGTTSDLYGVTSMTYQSPNGTFAITPPPFGSWSASNVALNLGVNSITISAVDPANNTGTKVMSITSDPNPPSISISTPLASGTYYTNLGSVTLTGTATDATTSVTSVQWQLGAGPLNSAPGLPGWSTGSIPGLADGPNTINVIATDAATNTATATLTVFKDSNAPNQLDIASNVGPPAWPMNPTTVYTNQNNITFTGTAADNPAGIPSGLLDVKWTNALSATNGTATGTPAAWNTGTIGLLSGSNVITITVRDKALNSLSRNVTVVYDNAAPTVAITSPASGSYLTSTTTISLGGTVGDSGGSGVASMAWSTTGAVTTTSGTVSFLGTNWPNPAGSLVIDLAGGVQTITVSVTDTAGNSAITTLVVTRDITPPALAVSTPAIDPFYTTGSTVNLAGTASDASGIQNVTYTVGVTGPFTAIGTTSWNANNVPLAPGSNTIVITAKDNSNLTTPVTITVIRDNVLPTVAIGSPSGSSFVTKNATLAISGTAGDNFKVNAVQWSTGGGFTNATLVPVTPPSSYTWSASIPLSPGLQTVTIQAVDAAGNISSPSPTLIVTLDQTNPQINFTTPTTAITFLTSSPQLPAVTPPPAAIAGTASDNVAVAQIEYSLNGAAFTVIAGATTSFTVPTVLLNAGSNTVDIRATDTAGNPFTKTMTVTYDAVLPTVSIVTPQPSGTVYTAATTVTLSGSAADANGINKVEWRNNGAAYAVIAGATTSWTTPAITLNQISDNVIDIRATDNAGNTNFSTLTVRYDNTKPTITVTAPPVVTKTTPITISGTSSDVGGAGVTGISWARVEGGASGVVSPPFAAWSTSVPLANGTNTITFTATDGAGNTQAATAVVVVLDTTNPTVTITAPTSASTYYTNQASVNLGGSASDNVAVQQLQYQINGGTLTGVLPVNPWTLTGVPVSGTTIINLVATDTATNTGSKNITVITDIVPPTISVTPPSPSVVNTTSVIISGSASDALSGIATVTWVRTEGGATGSATYTGPGWTATVPLVAGTNTFTFTATDVAGNSTPAGAVVVTRDNVNPIPVITAPGFPTFATNNATFTTLAGTASDNVGLNKVEYQLNGTGYLPTGGSPAVWNVATMTLTQAVNTIDVKATDNAGNFAVVTLTVTLDLVAPTVAITTPVLGTLGGGGAYTTGASPVSIGGTASDAVGIQRIDWTNVTTGATGSTTGTSWSVSIPLIGSPNTISVRAVDTAGNLSTPDTLVVTLNTSAAIVTITTPTTASSFATAGTPITISGTSSHSTGITKLEWQNNGLPVLWNLIADGGGAALLSSAFSFAPVLSVPSNVITVRATPTSGTASIGTITILYDTTPPTVGITTNAGANFATSTTPVLLTGTAGALGISGLQSVVWVNAATSGTQDVTNTSWTASIGLTPGANVITVTAKNGAGTAVSQNITVTYDLTPPTVNITGPTTNATFQTTAAAIALAGTASDNVALFSVKYQVNGGALTDVTAPLTNWTVASVGLGAGTGIYVINVVATDTAGNTSTDTLTVTRDNDLPTLTITSPANPTYTDSSPIVVTGTAGDNQGLASVTWTNAANSTSGTASGTTNWTASGITLAAGANLITVRATDTLGNFLTQTVTVNYDITVPVVNIALPTSGPNWATNAGSVNLSGTVTDNDQVASVSATNSANNVTVVSGVGAFPAWATNGIALIAGANAITVTATDRSGNTSTKVITVTRDNTDPTVAVTSPVASGGTYVTGASSLQISGNASDDLAVQKVDWSNPAATASGTAAGTTTWVATVPLVSGPNVISFTATDTAGNVSSGSVSITVNRDTSLPSINIVVPDPLLQAITKIPSIAVSGNAQDSEGLAQVTWSNAATGGSGVAANGSAAGGVNAAWSASIPLAIGVNTITVTAVDISGNTSTDTVDVTLDIAAPTVSISAPTSGPSWVVSGLSVTLGGQTTDNVGLQSVSVTNSAVPGTTSANISSGLPAWTIPGITLALGTNILTVTSTDKAGNTATAVLTVISDGTPPSVLITAPTSNPTFYTNVASVSLGGTASDNVGLQEVDWSNGNTGGSGTAIGTSVWLVSIPLGPGSNLISVTSKDTSGRVSSPPATITVILDTTVPVIAVTAPTLNLVPIPPTYTTNLAPIAFGGTVTDASGVASVTWTNAATGGSGAATVNTVPITPTWSVSIPVINGLNGIVFTATDVAGNTTTTSVNVTFDAAPPAVAITAPTNLSNYITNATTVALGGTAADNVAIQSIVWANSANGTSGSAGSSSPWSVPSVNLALGDNPITVTVTDTAGNSTVALVIVRQDLNLPVIAITNPVASLGTYVTNNPNLAVLGTASDDVAVFGVTVNGSPATLGASWSGVVTLALGSNTITAIATDTAGNTKSTFITVILDTTAPTMAVTGHNDGDTFSTVIPTVTLAGTAADPGGAVQTVSWANTSTGGSGTAVFGSGTWTAPIALTPGTNFIVITTLDAAGNVTQETLTIIHDTQAPTISINTPTAASSYNTTALPLDTIVLGGGAADNVNVASVIWTNAATGGTGATSGPTSAWSASVPLAVGSNTITVVATDDVGNSASDVITVTYDPTAPNITITSPTPSPTYSTTVTPLTFSGTASDNLSVVSINWSNTSAGAVGAASGTTAWTASGVPLISGLNTIVFTVTDGVGNTQTATITVTYDVTPPVVVITPPTTPTQVRPLLLSGTATDNIGVATVTWSNSLTGSSGTTTVTGGPSPAPYGWSASIPMIPGPNVITIKATDLLGNLGTASVSVDYSHEIVAPTLTIVNPAPPTFTSPTQIVTIDGTATDNVGVTSISWINKTTRVYGVASYAAPNWVTDVPLAAGPNVIDITASDDVGNAITQTITITFVAPVETNPPSITITAPTTSDTFDVTSSPLHLEANAIDDIGVVSVTWINQGTFGSGDSGWGTFWYASIPLVSGSNVITVTAIDTSGNTTTDTITVTYTPPVGDPVPPAVNIVTPLASGTYNVTVPSVNLTGTASDNDVVDAVTFSNNATGAFATASGTTAWSATGVALLPGVNIITARAIDPAGNVGQATLVVLYTPPAAAKPVAPVIPAGMCGLTGLEVLLGLGALWLRRRCRRRST